MKAQILGLILSIISITLWPSSADGAIRAKKKGTISSRFLTSVKFQYRGKVPIHRIIYGNDNYGYYSTSSHKVNRGQISIKLIPPGYRYKITFFIEKRPKGPSRLVKLGSRKFISPVPKAFAHTKGHVKHGRFSTNFMIMSGAILRGKYWNPNFISRNLDVYRKSKYRVSFTSILNRIGEIVWLHVPTDREELFHTYVAAKPISKGVYGMLLGKKAGLFQIVRHDGKVMRSVRSRDADRPYTMHHDFMVASKDSILAISSRAVNTRTRKAKKLGNSFLADTIIKVDLKRNSHKKVFDFLKIYQPHNNKFWTGDDKGDHKFVVWNREKVDFDFLHLNSIERVDDGYLIGIRNLNKVVLMDRRLNKIKWTIGWEENDTFKIHRETDRFHHIHTPIKTKGGNIMIFDNGYAKDRSRVVEYELDYNRQIANRVWSFAPKPSLYSKDRGSIATLESGNVLAYFVNPKLSGQKTAPIPPRDVLLEIDYRNKYERARMIRRFDVLSPGYRAIPIKEVGLETYIGESP